MVSYGATPVGLDTCIILWPLSSRTCHGLFLFRAPLSFSFKSVTWNREKVLNILKEHIVITNVILMPVCVGEETGT